MSSQLLRRKRRATVFAKTPKYVYFTRGDIVSCVYKYSGFFFFFIGLCLSVSKKAMLTPQTTIKLRNIIDKVPVDIVLSVNRLMRFSTKFLDFMRKRIYYKSAKLYYLRRLSNRFTRVYTYLYN